ncbi:MAG: hypothetical protein U9N49_00955 [Campylobacterota bacterium]|nr:hypothetical protein [Campylobacterota bacterium]
MIRTSSIIVLLIFLSSCSMKSRTTPYLPIVKKAMKRANPVGQRILSMAHTMAYENPKVVQGSCWDYINAIYIRSGYGVKKKVIFKGSKRGSYAPIYMIESGDWLYHINHEYRGVEHSGIFIDWIDLEKRKALMLSYRGGKSCEPARYKIYTLTSVYNIKRGRG